MSMLAYQYNQPKWPGDLDLLTSKVVSESRVTWATSVPILVFLGLSVLELYRPDVPYVTDRQTDRQTSDVRQKHRLMPPPYGCGGIIIIIIIAIQQVQATVSRSFKDWLLTNLVLQHKVVGVVMTGERGPVNRVHVAQLRVLLNTHRTSDNASQRHQPEVLHVWHLVDHLNVIRRHRQLFLITLSNCPFTALTLLDGRREGHPGKKVGCWFVGGDDLTAALHAL